ncbi:MAG: alpha/beta fold hydrolase [Candidatus Binataceae bacterium]
MPARYIEVRGNSIYYHYVGATTLPDVIPDFSRERKIIFVHAAGSNGHAWHNQLDYLGGSHSPIAFDFPGHGRSSGVEGMKSIGEYADFLAAFADSLEIESAVIAGRSMGGAVAMEFALRHPARVSALILIATAAKFTFPAERLEGLKAVAAGRVAQSFTNDGYSPKTVAEKFAIVREGWMEQIKTDPRVRYMDTMACAGADLREKIGAIQTPALILAGADDKITPPSDAELIARQIRGARLEIIPDAAHNLPNEQSSAVNSAIAAFLEEPDRR